MNDSGLRARPIAARLAAIAAAAALGAAGVARAGEPTPSPQGQADPGKMPPGHGMMAPGQMGPGGMMVPGGMMGPDGMMGGGMMGPGGMMGGATNDRPWITIMLDQRQELGLSAEQVGTLFDLRENFQRVARSKMEELQRTEQELDRMLGPGPVDLAAVEAKLKEIEAKRTDLRLSRLKVIEQAKQVLTADQQKRLVAVADRLRSSTRMAPMGSGTGQGDR